MNNQVFKSFGTVLRDNKVIDEYAKQFPLLTNEMLDLTSKIPKEFDGRDAWLEYLPPPNNMLDCGRGWVFSIVECLSTRYNLFVPFQNKLFLTSIQPVICPDTSLMIDIPITDGDSSISQTNCHLCSNSVYYALLYGFFWGFSPTSCFIYEDLLDPKIGVGTPCNYDTHKQLEKVCYKTFGDEEDECLTDEPARRFRCINFANVENKEETIMREIFTNGPVVCSYLIYDDFVNDYDGKSIYTGPKKDSRLLGGNSGMIIGWGEENEIKYWIVSNSWGINWGLGGYFKIKRGENLLKLEDNIVTMYPMIGVDYIYWPESIKMNPDFIKRQREIIVNPYNYYPIKVEELIKNKKIKGSLQSFYNVEDIPDIRKIDVGEISIVPIVYKKDVMVDILNIIIIILGIYLGIRLFKKYNK